MCTRSIAALLVLAASTAQAAEKTPASPPQPIADYAANDRGITYQVALEGVSGQFLGHLVVRVMKGEKELARVPAFDVPNGHVQRIEPADDRWTIQPQGVSADEGPTLLTVTPFALKTHEQGLLLSRALFRMYPSSDAVAIGWAHGAVKELWRERRAGNEHILQPEARQVGGEPELVVVDWSLKTGFVGQYAFFKRDPKTGRFTRELAAYGVAIRLAKNQGEFLAALDACQEFSGRTASRLLSGPSFPALKESGGVAMALTDDESQAAKWVKELASCHKGTAPVVVRLK